MKIQREVYLEANGIARVHVYDGIRTGSYVINVEEAMNLYPERSVHVAVSKLAKYRFLSENAFTGYD